MVLTHKEWIRILKTMSDYLARIINEKDKITHSMNIAMGQQRDCHIFKQNIILHRKKQLETLEKEIVPIREKLLIYVEFDKLMRKVINEKKKGAFSWSEEEVKCLEILMVFKSDKEIGQILKRSKSEIMNKRERLQNNPLVNLT